MDTLMHIFETNGFINVRLYVPQLLAWWNEVNIYLKQSNNNRKKITLNSSTQHNTTNKYTQTESNPNETDRITFG